MRATASDGGSDDNKVVGACLTADVVRLLCAKAVDATLRLSTSATANDLRNLGFEIRDLRLEILFFTIKPFLKLAFTPPVNNCVDGR